MEKPGKAGIENILALTPLQEGLLFHYLQEPKSDYYFVQLSLEISGAIDIGRFERAWDIVLSANEMLRVVFRWKKLETPVQLILKEYKLQPLYVDFSGKAPGEKKGLIEQAKAEDRKRGFDLQDIAFRVTLCRLEKEKYVMIISYHHILYDGWSSGIILSEFFRAYHTLDKSKGEGNQGIEPCAKRSFKEFIQWLRGRDKNKQRRFWQEYLMGFDTPAELPIKEKKGITGLLSPGTANYPVILEKAVKDRWEGFLKGSRLTFASFFYSAWGILLQRYCRSDDVVFGTTVSGRSAPLKGIEDMVGLFINTVPLRVDTGAGKKIRDLLYHIDDMLLMREEYESTPLVDIKKYGPVESHEELFDSIVVLENYPLDRELMGENRKSSGKPLVVDSYSIVEVPAYDLTVGITVGDEIGINFIYNPSLFEKSGILGLSRHFTAVLHGILNDIEGDISVIELLSGAEKRQVLIDFNRTAGEYPRDKTIHELFAEQAARTPDGIAIGIGGRHAVPVNGSRLTYRELNKRSGRLAHLLRSGGVGANAAAAVMFDRCIEMIIAMMAVLKAGGAYLPVDPDYPAARKAYLLENSGAKVLLTRADLDFFAGRETPAPLSAVNIIYLDDGAVFPRESFTGKSAAASASRDLAYVIYTSGTTGKPKGVAVPHRSLVNFIYAMSANYSHDFGPGDNCLSLTNFCFDVSVCEIFMPLVFGSRMVILPREKVFDPGELAKAVVEEGITFTYLPPGLLKDVFASLKPYRGGLELNKMLVGVEPIKDDVLEDYLTLNPSMQIVNGYGPTEAVICATAYRYRSREPAGRRVPIGTPLANNTVVLLDHCGHPVPVGVPGELCIAGDGLASGYLNNPALTAETFILGDYRSYKSYRTYSPGIIYRTGDLALWLADGNLLFLGRKDTQVKIRGFRVELGEIESRLANHPAVKDVVVLAAEREGVGKYLCAYIVLNPGRRVDVEELRVYLAAQLPGYMVPAYFVVLEGIPLTPNGKVDRKALPGPEAVSAAGSAPPQGKTEKELANIWSKVLGIEKTAVGRDSHFFELGGHSLNVTRLVGLIHKTFNIRVPFSKIFISPTLRELANFISKQEESRYRSILPVEAKEYYELTPAQQRFFVLQQMDAGFTAYNINGVMALAGTVDREKFREVFSRLIGRHESFRTSFHLVGGRPVQRVHDKVGFAIENRGLEEFVRPFDLSCAPLLRVGLAGSGSKAVLMIDMHHIIADGMSMKSLVRDFTVLYAGSTLPPCGLQYKDYACWQNMDRNREARQKQAGYWQEKFRGEIPVLELPIDFGRPRVRDFEGSRVTFAVTPRRASQLKDLALERGTTLYVVLLAVFNLFLAKISNQETLVVGTAAAGRRHPDLEPLIGLFVNTLALINYPQAGKSIAGFLAEVDNETREALENQDYPFEELVETAGVNRDASRNPLFDAMFVLQNIEGTAVEIPGLKLTPRDYESGVSRFDLTLEAVEDGDTLCFTLEYWTKLFAPPTVERFVRFFQETVGAVLRNPRQKIGEIDILSQSEKRLLLEEFNNTAVEYPQDKTIPALFAEQAARTPDSMAIDAGVGDAVPLNGNRLTYRELNEKSHQLTLILRDKGVGPDTVVGIMVERSLEMIIGILGILKAGGAYLPIDPGYPEKRVRYMLADSNAGILLSESNEPGRLSEGIEVIKPGEAGAGLPTHLTHPTHPTHLCYVIYTSGSTGRPRGVAVRHRGFVNLFYAHRRVFGIGAGERMSQVAGPGFDAMAFEVWPCLLNGGTLFIVDEETRLDPLKMKMWLIANKITVSFQSTSAAERLLLETWPEQGVALRVLMTAGEQLGRYPRTHLPFRFYNLYGPTEDTVWTTWYEVKVPPGPPGGGEKNPPIGRPVNNHRVYIMDSCLNLQPAGVAGELCTAGAGAAVGYLNRPELTAEKFVEDPFLPGERMYKSGDLARWLSGGNLEFLGRIDSQVKIRGFRIETGEIENLLLEHPGIRGAVVVPVTGTDGDKSLCAYIVSPGDLSPQELCDYLSSGLPGYMIPSYFVSLENIPLTPNGKIDRSALPVPDAAVSNRYAAPRDKKEERLVSLWAEVLGIEKERIGIDDNFFRLGGHSLKAALLTGKIHEEFSVRLPILEFFKTPTIRGISLYMKKTGIDLFVSIGGVEERDYYPLSPAQKRLYLLQQMGMDSTVYNISGAFELEGPLDGKELEGVFRRLIRRHESLRTSFFMIAGQPVQRVHDKVEFAVENCGLEDFVRSFDLSCAPLLRVGLAGGGSKRILMIDMHHIIADGMSMGVLVRDFTALYAGEAPPVPRVRYKDYARWRNGENSRDAYRKQAGYWREKFRQEIPVLELPVDFNRPPVQSFEGSRVTFAITPRQTSQLKALALERGTTLYMVLLAVFNVFLSRAANQETLVVGTVTAGRRHPDLEPLIGMFVNTLALINYPQGGKSFAGFLAEVNNDTRESFENQDYPFEELVETAGVNRDASRNPLFDAMFVLQNIEGTVVDIPGLKLIPYDSESGISRFDLTLEAVEERDTLCFTLEYCTKLFKPATVERFIRFFQEITGAVLSNPRQKIAEIDILSPAEKRMLLEEFNDTPAPYPLDKAIHELFAEGVEKAPDSVAVIGPGQYAGARHAVPLNGNQLTYRELNEKSHQLALILREKGVGPDTVVGIMVERSLEMIIGILGILKAGGAYLPIDPGYPEKRVRYMLADSNAGILLSELSQLSEGIETIKPGEAGAGLPTHPTHPTHLCYVIYTSGSTGRPRGVAVRHRGFVNLFYTHRRIFGIGPGERMSQVAGPGFDAMAFEVWPCLLNGGTLFIAGEETRLDPLKMKMWLIANKITVSFQSTSAAERLLLETWPEQGVALRVLMTGGEQLGRYPRTHLPFRFYNLYGPTEDTVCTTWYEVKVPPGPPGGGEKNPPIGRPVNNHRVYIMGSCLNLQPAGVAGELCTAGEGVAVGYLNRPELTAEKFVEDPFVPGERMYKSGDLARWLSDGNLEFLGRIDSQVKIRGFRIELGEIKSRLLEHDLITDAVVTAREDTSGQRYLCAYTVSKEHLDTAVLKEFLLLSLPGYMVPAYFVFLEKIPLNANGKVNPGALPKPEIKAGEKYAPPTDELEEKLVGLWADVLGIEKEVIGIHDNFFDLGGNSLKVVQLSGRIKSVLGKDVPVLKLFRYTSISSFRNYLNEEKASPGASDEKQLETIDKGKRTLDRLKTRMRKL